MKKVIYCKYNLNRAPQFQTKTVIYQDNGERYIEKYPLTESANVHMNRFENNYKLIQDLYPAIHFITSKKVEGGIRYPYITGIPMDEVLKGNIQKWDDVLPQFKKMISEIYQANPAYQCEFVKTEGFQEIFGDVDCKDDVCLSPCNLDVIFDNLILADDKITAFDYEWVCDFPVPEKYIIYRVLCRFYDKYLHYLEKKFTFEEYIAVFDFTEEEKLRYRKMEDAFIQYIYANGDAVHQNTAYKRNRMGFDQVKNAGKVYEEYNAVVDVLHNTESEYLKTIERLDEAARLKKETDEELVKVTDILHNTESEYLKTIERLDEAARLKKETDEELVKVTDILHNTESEYLKTIERLDEAARLKVETDQELIKVSDQLHKTEKEYLLTVERLNEAAKLKMEADATILSQIDEINKQKDEVNKVTDLLHNTEKEYVLTIERLNEAARLKMEADALIIQQNEQIQQIQHEYNLVVNSKAWKLTKPLRLITRGLRSVKREGFMETLRKLKNKIVRKLGIKQNQGAAQGGSGTGVQEDNVLLPIIEVQEDELNRQRNEHFENEYKISIITPLFNTPQNFLIELLDSVKDQTYTNWEFCLVNFSTTDFDRVDKTCQEYAKADKRISYHVADENRGISENTNTCISYATGDYIGLLDHDDILHPCALYEVIKVISETGADFVYTDEVKFNESIKNVFLPNFKPDFSADELRAHNYICHFNVYKTALYHEVGGYRKEFDGSQDHDIVLRLTEKANKIVHIPKILYYWRVHPNSVAQSIDAKSYATDAGIAAVTEQLERMGEKQYVQSVIGNIPLYRIRTNEDENADLTVLIWNGNDEAAVKRTMKSVNRVVKCDCIVVQNDEHSIEENISNALKDVKTKYVLFLCAGLKVQSDTFVKEFMIYARRNDIATIDCMILTDANTIYSGGACMTGDAGMPIKLRCMGGSKDYAGYENGMYHSRNVTASTGLCTFMDVELWRASNGFESENSKCFMLEYSYKMWKNGKNNLWIPFIKASGLDTNMQQEYISGLCSIRGDYDLTDAYVSEYVAKLHLE